MKTEEVTLEPTPPLKRIYTPPSIKVLFALNHCKSSFRKFTTNSIKTNTSQYNKNIIHNLSDHKLTEDEFSVLIKVLSFVPTPTKSCKQEANKSWKKVQGTHANTIFSFVITFKISSLPFLKGNPLGHPFPLTNPL